jgi:hypothetical protein
MMAGRVAAVTAPSEELAHGRLDAMSERLNEKNRPLEERTILLKAKLIRMRDQAETNNLIRRRTNN